MLSRIVTLLLIPMSFACSAPFRTTVALTKPDIEAKMAKHFPAEKRALIAKVELSNPRVLFETDSDRIGLELDAEASLLHKKRTGTVAVMGRLEYRGETGTFHLVDPEIVRIDMPDLEEEHREAIHGAATIVVRATVPQIALHRVENSVERAFIRSVDVRDEQVLVELGL